MRERLRTGLLVASVVCWVTFLTYQSTTERTPEGETRRHTVGLPFSPWFTKTVEEKRQGGFRMEAGVTVLSWSWLVCVAGAVLLGVWERMKPAAVPESPATTGETP